MIPDDEILWVQYISNGNVTHIITSNAYRTKYYLYIITNKQCKKTKYTSTNPLDLDKYICRTGTKPKRDI